MIIVRVLHRGYHLEILIFLLKALNISREAPPGDWPPQAYVLVGREDLAATCSSSFSKGRDELKKTSTTTAGSVKNPVVDVDDAFLAAPYMLHLRPITIPQSIDSSELGDAEGQGTAVDGCISDGMDHMSSTTAPLRFGSDLRLNEVRCCATLNRLCLILSKYHSHPINA